MSFKPSWLKPSRYPRLLIEHTNGKTSNIPLNDYVQWERRDTELVVFYPHYVRHFPLVNIEHYAVVDAVGYPQRMPDDFALDVMANTDRALDAGIIAEDYREHKTNGGTLTTKCILSTSCIYCQRVTREASEMRPTIDFSFLTEAFRVKTKTKPAHDCSDPTCPFI